MRIYTSLGLMVLLSGSLGAQVPSTDIYVVSIEGEGDERPRFGEPRNLTDREGYDNQPAFLLDGSGLLYTSIRDDQADIYRYDFAADTAAAVTSTPESEYSPTPIDGGRGMSVVRVEADGRQRLWRFALTATKTPGVELLLEEAEPVGYHAWGEQGALLLFVLGEPHTLQWWVPGADPTIVAESIGRSLHRIPGSQRFSFVQQSEDGNQLSSFDPATGQVEVLIGTRPEREDHAWDREGRAWMSDGSRLYRYCPACGGGWRRMVDFGNQGLGAITRLAFSPDGRQLALVVERAAETSPTE